MRIIDELAALDKSFVTKPAFWAARGGFIVNFDRIREKFGAESEAKIRRRLVSAIRREERLKVVRKLNAVRRPEAVARPRQRATGRRVAAPAPVRRARRSGCHGRTGPSGEGGPPPPRTPADTARLRHLARCVHRLGPGVLFYFLADIERDKPVRPTLEAYAELAPYGDLIDAYGGAMPPRPFAIDGGA
jgi:hypothetical protein